MTTVKALNEKPYAGNPHVALLRGYDDTSRFDEGKFAPCAAEVSFRRVHCRRQPEGRASVCAATPGRGSQLYKKLIVAIIGTLAACALPVAGYEYIISGDPISASTNHVCIAPLAPQAFATGGYAEATTRVLALRSDEFHAFMLIIR